MKTTDSITLARLLQLTNANLPIGAFSYSEGIETLVDQGTIKDVASLKQWIVDSLRFGSLRIDAAIMLRLMNAAAKQDTQQLTYWDAWLTASRESEEMRAQSKNMGRALWRLFQELKGNPYQEEQSTENFISIFAQVAVAWEIPIRESIYAYLHSWCTNIITAGVRLIPIGQSEGQRVLWWLPDHIEAAVQFAECAQDSDLYMWNAGQALASMNHETLYCRLYRS